MNQNQINYFLTVYKTRNIQAAANELFVSRQGVSKTIRLLEEELAQPLFLRTPQGLQPTDFAIALLPHVQRLAEEYAAISGMNSLASQGKNVVTLYTLDHIPAYLGAQLLANFHSLYPDIILSIVEATDDHALEALSSHRCDLSIVTGPLDNTKYHGTPLFFSHYAVRMLKTHPLATKEKLHFADLAGVQLIGKGRAYRCYRQGIDKNLLLQGYNVNLLAELTDENIITDLIRRTNAINIGYDYTCAPYLPDDMIIKPLDAEPDGQYIYLVENNDILLSKAARIFKEFLITQMK